MKSNSIISASLILAIAGMGSSCSSSKDKKVVSRDQDSASKNTKKEISASEDHDAYYSVVEFDRNSESLNESSKRSIRTFIEKAKKSGKEFDDIKIMAWADKEYPAKGMNVDKKDVSIASERSESIERFLKKDLATDGDFATYNMAKRPNKMSEFLKSDDFETKKTFEVSGSTPTAESSELATFMNNKASKALIMVDYE